MLVFPNCKINLGLLIIGKRLDGYHAIESIFYPVPLNDALEIIESASGEQQLPGIGFSSSGNHIAGEVKDNLCVKACQLLKKDFFNLPPLNIHLYKAIPMGAGLGGGSADAAFALNLLNTKFKLNLSIQALQAYALILGSDCPFFIINEPCIATGRGEIMQPVNLSLAGYYLLLVNPGIHINTRWAFNQLNKNISTSSTNSTLQTAILQPVQLWKYSLPNDFEPTVFETFPEIQIIKSTLYDLGALFAGMSGSGSTVFGIFEKKPTPPPFPPHYFVRSILL